MQVCVCVCAHACVCDSVFGHAPVEMMRDKQVVSREVRCAVAHGRVRRERKRNINVKLCGKGAVEEEKGEHSQRGVCVRDTRHRVTQTQVLTRHG